jgi:hypothetical protein
MCHSKESQQSPHPLGSLFYEMVLKFRSHGYALNRPNSLDVHFFKITNCMFKCMNCCFIHSLLALHSSLHNAMVRLESLYIIILRSKYLLLDSLTETVLGDSRDNLFRVLLLGVNPAYDLIHLLGSGSSCSVNFLDLDHGLLDGRDALLHFCGHHGIIEYSTGYLAVTSAKTKHKVKSRFLLNVVVRQSAAVLELLSGKDETLLIRRNSLLILNLGLDVVNGIGWLHDESDGLSSKGLHENLHVDVLNGCFVWKGPDELFLVE